MFSHSSSEVGGELLRSRSRVRPGVAFGAGLLLLAGCSSGSPSPVTDSQGIVTSTATAPKSTETKAPSVRPTTECDVFGTTQKQTRRLDAAGNIRMSPGSSVSALRLGKHACSERLVIQIDGIGTDKSKWPSVVAEYVKPPIKNNPSDLNADIKGNAFYSVTIGSGSEDKVYKAVRGLSEGPVEAVAQTQNFEGDSTYVVGLDSQFPVAYNEVRGTDDCPGLCVVLDFATAQ